jgi:hypothetical protein
MVERGCVRAPTQRDTLWRVRKRPPELFAPASRQREIAYDFVLEQLEPASPTTRAMFGSTAVYLDERVVFILRNKGDADDGVWFAYEPEREPEVLALLPSAARITRIPNARGWRKLAAAHEDFESDVLRACRIAREVDSPLGKIPVRQSKKKQSTAAGAPAKPRAGAAKKTAPKQPAKRARKAAPGAKKRT